MGKTKKYEKRWDEEEKSNKKPVQQRNQKRIKNALRSNNIQDLVDHTEDY